MNNLIPPPDALGIPSPPPVFLFFSLVTLVLHFVFMNYVLGGTLIVAVHEWLFGHDPKIAKSNGLMIKVMPFTLSLSVTMGVAPLLFVQVLYGQFFYTSNIMMGGWWLLILLLVVIAFYNFYVLIAKRPPEDRSSVWMKLGILVNVPIFLAVAFLLTNNAVLVENPRYWTDIYTGARNFIAPDWALLGRYLHNVLSAVAVAGLWMVAIGRYRLRYYPHHADTANWMVRAGLIWAAGATAVNILVGIGYLSTLTEHLKEFMGNGPFFVGWSISVITGLLALVLMILALVRPANVNFIWGAILLMVITLVGMAMGRELLRIVSLQEYYQFDQLVVRPSTSSFILFLGTFVAGLAVLWYMVWLVWSMPLLEEDGTSRKRD